MSMRSLDRRHHNIMDIQVAFTNGDQWWDQLRTLYNTADIE